MSEIVARGNSVFVGADGARLHALEYGEGPSEVLIIPGITSPAGTWEFVSEALGRSFHVYTMDGRGRGYSDPGPRYSLFDYAADAARLIAGLGLHRPVVIGHSMGARIAVALGVQFPDSARALIVVDPPLSGRGRAPYPFPLDGYVEALRKAKAGTTLGELRREFPAWTEEQVRRRLEWLPTCDETAVVESYKNFHEEDFFAWWRKLRLPALFMYGAISPVVPESARAEVAAGKHDATIVSIAGAAHMIPWDNFDVFLDTCVHFIEEHTT